MKRLVSPFTALALAVLLLLSCNLFDAPKRITFPAQGDLYIHYGDDTTFVVPQTLLAQGGGPLNGYTWTKVEGSYPTGTTVDPLTGVFKATGGVVARAGGTFKMTATAGSYSGTHEFRVRAMDWGSGFVPWMILQQYDPNTVDPSVLTLADAQAERDYGASLFVCGGTPPYYWTEDRSYAGRTDLVTVGLSVQRNTGVVVGTPPASTSGKTVRFRVIVTDADGDTALFAPVYTINIR